MVVSIDTEHLAYTVVSYVLRDLQIKNDLLCFSETSRVAVLGRERRSLQFNVELLEVRFPFPSSTVNAVFA